MFHFSTLRSPAQQRRELLSAAAFAEIPVHPAVQRQLASIRNMPLEDPPRISSVIGLFFWVFKGVRELIVEMAVWSAIGALVVLGAVFVVQEVFQPSRPLALGLLFAALYLVLKLLQAGIEYRNSRQRLQVHRGVQAALYGLLNQKLATISPAGRARFSKGQLKTLVSADVEAIEDFLSAASLQFVPLIVSCLVLVPALCIVSGMAGLVGLLAALAVVPVAMIGALVIERCQSRAQAEQDRLTTAIGEWVKNIRLVRFLGWGSAVEREVSGQLNRYVVMSALRHLATIAVWAISYSWAAVPLLAIFAFAAVRHESVGLMEVFSSFWLLDHIVSQVQWIPYSLSMYGPAAASAKRVIELLDQPGLANSVQPAPTGQRKSLGDPVAIALRGVTVRFGELAALDCVDLEISLLQRTAIVGSVASGKTTLLEAIVGELPVTEGSIEVQLSGGERLPLWRADVLDRVRQSVAYSPQQPFLSNATMRLNVDLSGSASLEDVQMAVLAAQLNQDLALFPRGLDEEVGESGINLSGGQKQRVSLARAFISKRPVLVLDDPLSAVDSATERALMDEIMSTGKGVVLVSHRLAELERCDRVIVLRDGRIVEDGVPTVLARAIDSEFSRFLLALEEHGR